MKYPYSKNKKIHSLFIFLLVVIMGFSACQDSSYIAPEDGYYTCSMHPQVIKQEDVPCPICQMKLTKVTLKKKQHDHSKHKGKIEDHKGHKQVKKIIKLSKHFRFSLTDALLTNSNVYTVAVKKEKFSKAKTFSGHVDYNEDPNRLTIVNTKYSGWIERLYVSKEGQWVKKGQLLLAAYSPKILAAKQEYLTTYNTIKQLYTTQGKAADAFKKDSSLRAARQKLLNLDVPYYQIRRIEKNLKADRLTYFTSPISGVIIKKNVLQGSHIKPGMQLFRIADLRVLWIYMHIFEKDIPFVKKGLLVKLHTSAYPGKIFRGRVDLIYPFFQKKTRDVKVRIIVPNYKYQLKPGMYVQVDVKSVFPGTVVTIPAVAVIYSGKKNYVFVSLGRGEFEVRPVIVLARSAGKAVIAKGLKQNELVVANGQFLLDSEASLKEALQKGSMAGHNH